MNDLFEQVYDRYSKEYSKLLLREMKKRSYTNLTINQIEYLNVINTLCPVKVSDISKELNNTKASTSIMIQKLESMDLVYKKKSDIDKRSSFVYITEKGKEVLDMDKKVFQKLGDYILDLLDDKESMFLEKILRKIIK